MTYPLISYFLWFIIHYYLHLKDIESSSKLDNTKVIQKIPENHFLKFSYLKNNFWNILLKALYKRLHKKVHKVIHSQKDLIRNVQGVICGFIDGFRLISIDDYRGYVAVVQDLHNQLISTVTESRSERILSSVCRALVQDNRLYYFSSILIRSQKNLPKFFQLKFFIT